MKRIICAVTLLGTVALAAEQILENDQVRIAIDGNASITQLVDKQSAPGQNLIARPLPGFWKLIFHRGRVYENVVEAKDQQYRMERSGDALRIMVDRLKFREETLDIRLTFTVRVQGDEVRWTARVENRAPVTIVDFFFPQVGGIEGLGAAKIPDQLMWPSGAGARIRNLKASLRARVDQLGEIEEPVNAVANQHLEATYPGSASMDWYELTNGDRGIYFASYDSTFMAGALRVSRLFDAGGVLQFMFAKYLFLRQGETWTSGDYVTSPHPGTWHTGAQKYRQWANTWFRPKPKPEWVEQVKGMYLVIMRQQYGERMWSYRDLPLLSEDARKSGIDMVALFGWTEAGHDNRYPVYQPDPEMGGEAALREGLAEVAKAGGRTILYINGHIMDAGSPFYKETGERMAAKTMWGSPYYEQYNKSFQSSFLRNFSRKLFAPVCPGDPEWEKVMLATGRQLLNYGPTGLIYDQLGYAAYPCFGTGRERESEAFSAGRRKLLSTLRTLKQDRPDFGFMIEHFTDAYADQIDIIHGTGNYQLSETAFPQLMRYTFPEVISTSRQQAPRLDAKQVNFALAYGFRFEVEVRYGADMETIRRQEKTHLRDYMRKVSELRDRYWDLLGSGTYQDDRGVENRNRAVTATRFAKGARSAVVLWNNTTSPQIVSVNVAGKRMVEAAGVNGKLGGMPGTLGPQEVAVAIYE
jgi:hypothetical protein